MMSRFLVLLDVLFPIVKDTIVLLCVLNTLYWVLILAWHSFIILIFLTACFHYDQQFLQIILSALLGCWLLKNYLPQIWLGIQEIRFIWDHGDM